MVEFRSVFLLLAFLTIASATVDKNVERVNRTLSSTRNKRYIPPLPEGYYHFSDINTAYKIHHYHVNWHLAEVYCILEGAHLAVADTWEKVYRINSLQPFLEWIWIGIHRRPYSLCNWRAVHGGPLQSPLPWGIFTHVIAVGNCVSVSAVVDGIGCWPCNIPRMFACEIPDVD